MTINNYTFFSAHGNDFPVTANADGKLYMMLTGMNYNDFRFRHSTPALNTALNRVYTNTAFVVGGRYFELKDHSVTLKPAQANFVHAVINIENMDNPVSITVEDQDNTNSTNINDGTGTLKVCFEQITTSGSAITAVTYKPQNTIVDKLTVANTINMGKVATITQGTGFGRNATLTRIGNMVTIYSEQRHTSAPPNGWNRSVATNVPVGFRPATNTQMWQHDLSNANKFCWLLFQSNGQVDLYGAGSITTTDYIISSASCYITNDPFPT